MADPKRFDADPDPTFQADADPALDPDPDPNPNPLTRVKKFFLQINNYCFQSHCNFLSKNAGGRVRGEG